MTTNGARRLGDATRTEVVLGVDTHLEFHVGGSPRPPGQAPGRGEDTDDHEGLATSSPGPRGSGP